MMSIREQLIFALGGGSVLKILMEGSIFFQHWEGHLLNRALDGGRGAMNFEAQSFHIKNVTLLVQKCGKNCINY